PAGGFRLISRGFLRWVNFGDGFDQKVCAERKPSRITSYGSTCSEKHIISQMPGVLLGFTRGGSGWNVHKRQSHPSEKMPRPTAVYGMSIVFGASIGSGFNRGHNGCEHLVGNVHDHGMLVVRTHDEGPNLQVYGLANAADRAVNEADLKRFWVRT